MGVLKAKVGGVWQPIGQGHINASPGLIGFASQPTSQNALPTTETDLTGLTLTWTADPTHSYKTTVYVVGRQGGAAGEQYVFITDSANSQKRASAVNVTANGIDTHYFSVVETGLSGSTTRKARSSGSATWSTSAAPWLGFILVEDVTAITLGGPYPQLINAYAAGGNVNQGQSLAMCTLTTPVVPVGKSALFHYTIRAAQTTMNAFDVIYAATPGGFSATHQQGSAANSGWMMGVHRLMPGAGVAITATITVNAWAGPVSIGTATSISALIM